MKQITVAIAGLGSRGKVLMLRWQSLFQRR